jgi:hypothetical protein
MSTLPDLDLISNTSITSTTSNTTTATIPNPVFDLFVNEKKQGLSDEKLIEQNNETEPVSQTRQTRTATAEIIDIAAFNNNIAVNSVYTSSLAALNINDYMATFIDRHEQIIKLCKEFKSITNTFENCSVIDSTDSCVDLNTILEVYSENLFILDLAKRAIEIKTELLNFDIHLKIFTDS